MYTTILCATDGLEHSDRALRRATELAARDGAELHVVHVSERFLGGRLTGDSVALDEGELQGRIRSQIEKIAGDGHVRVTEHMTGAHGGHVAERVSAIADEVDADLVVVGSRSRSPLGGALLGSVAQRLQHICRRPLMILPRDSTPRRSATERLLHRVA